MLIALKKMASLHDKDRKEFTLTYAKYGQYFLTNPFTIRLGMLLAGKGSRLDYSIEGEKINRYLSSYKTTEEGQLKKVDSQRNENDDAIVESNNLNRGRALILGNEKPYIINGL